MFSAVRASRRLAFSKPANFVPLVATARFGGIRRSFHNASVESGHEPVRNGVVAETVIRRNFAQNAKAIKKPSACQVETPPFPYVIVYNQSRHASSSVVADIRAVWGGEVKIFQTLEEGGVMLTDANQAIYIQKGKWGDLNHFKERLADKCSRNAQLAANIAAKKVVFMPGWSAFAESAETAVKVQELGLVWPGTEPKASERLEKIGFKRICDKVGAPTPAFVVISEEDCEPVNLQDPAARKKFMDGAVKKILDMKSQAPGLVKSIHGGGGKGTAHLKEPNSAAAIEASLGKVVNEMNRVDGIYFEQRVNHDGDGRFFQLELEVDGDQVADGGRFVWFNSRLQKVVEIGLSDQLVTRFMPADLYQKARVWARDVAREAKNNTRATIEGLVFTDKHGKTHLSFIECNRRPQVENEALALLQQDSWGNRRYTFAELMMRAAGYQAPDFFPSTSRQVVLHARWLHGNPDKEGNITYQTGRVTGMRGPNLHWVVSELMAPGEISFTADPQLGKAVIVANDWESMCERATTYFTLRQPAIQGPSSTYGSLMQQMFSSPEFRSCKVASNETFKFLKIPVYPPRTLAATLEEQIAPILVHGYRKGEGVDPQRWPTENVCMKLTNIMEKELGPGKSVRDTPFTQYTKGKITRAQYIESLRAQLSDQGGAWVTVAPRDTYQQGNDSESAGITNVSRRNAEVWAERAGCVGYETGGAQYQAALIRGFDPAAVMRLGLPYNMPSHSLQRSQYVNGLAELTPEVRKPLFQAMRAIVDDRYARTGLRLPDTPWIPYNFHAGNYVDKSGWSPQDDTTGEMLEAGCLPMPNWVFSPHFSLEDLKAWTLRQIRLFESKGQQLDMIRIKNPGQGLAWTSETVWKHIEVMRAAFREATKGQREPIIYIHNHDFNGTGAHTGRELFGRAHKVGFSNLVIDGAWRKNGTHNDNTALLAGLCFTPEQKEALEEYNHVQQAIEDVGCRFDSRDSQMTPWDSDWAGGTEGSDIRIAKEYGIDPRKINWAKEVASTVFPLERAVTPFSEYKLRLGIAIMIEDKIQPKTPDAVVKFIKAGGKLKIGGDVLVGLKRWHTLVAKPSIVDTLLQNMHSELETAMGASSKLLTLADCGEAPTAEQIYTVLGYQGNGQKFIKQQGTGQGDLTPLLLAPHVLHRKPRTLPPKTRMELLVKFNQDVEVMFKGFGKDATGNITVGFEYGGQELTAIIPDPDAVGKAAVASGPRKADPKNKHEYGAAIPGEVLSYAVKVGDKLKAGAPMVVLESMKMEIKLSVPDNLDGHVVKNLSCKTRTATDQGDILKPGDLLLETAAA